jgi:filamentous hemagglutinin family protein
MLAASVMVSLSAHDAAANPQGGQISAGSATMQPSGTQLNVYQDTDRAVIDWKSFDIAPGETTTFHQPSASSAILNRIHDQNPSQIFGSLSANGIVALVNPNGMVFGQGSRVDVGSLIATTTDIPNERFLSGQSLLFGQPGETDAAIVNQGGISVKEGGLAALVAPQVTNAGVIEAKMGRVALGAGEIFTVDLYGDGLVALAASDRLREAAVEQTGEIRAAGGTVLLTTAEARRVMDRTVNMNGLVEVSSLTSEGGSIVLHAAEGTASVGGALHADSATSRGGRLQVTGRHVKVGAGAVLSATGGSGGGDIKIGGDYLGGGATPRAKTTRIETGATIDVSATGTGTGGRVIAWSDERTEFRGLIRAKGGLLGGDGGFVETSSKEVLVAHGLVDAGSPHGKGGEWLLDPNDITINATADANVAGSPDFTTTNDSAVVTVNSIQTALNAGTNVSITTGTAGANTQNGDITVASSISKTAGGDATLTLKAARNITVNAGVGIASSSNKLNMVFNADADAVPNQDGAVQLGNGTFTTNGGDLTIGGGANPLTTAAYGNSAINNGVYLNGSQVNAGGGNISIRGNGYTGAASNMAQTQHLRHQPPSNPSKVSIGIYDK